MKQIFEYICERTFLSDSLINDINALFQFQTIKKGEIIIEDDSRAEYLYFIKKGVLHNCYNHNGKEITSWFYLEGQFVTAWASFYSRRVSFERVVCLEDCELYYISYTNFQKLISDHPSFGNFARLLAEEILVIIDEFSKGWAFLSAKEKYDLIDLYFPNLEGRIKLGHIASFLGINQATLSRIRAKK